MNKSETKSGDAETFKDEAEDVTANTGPASDAENASSAEGDASGESSGGASGDASDAAADEAEAEYVPPDEEAYKMLVEKAAKTDLYFNELLRVKADLDNYQKRVRRERPTWEATAVRGFVRDLLPIVDNFERALNSATEDAGSGDGASDKTGDADSAASGRGGESFADGICIIHQMLHRALDDHGVVEIEALDKPFNPEFHEAVYEAPVPDRETGEIIEVQQKGYLHHEVVVRPSLVIVAKKVEPSALESGDDASAAEGESDAKGD
jgi:molecular chaperone GrpE